MPDSSRLLVHKMLTSGFVAFLISILSLWLVGAAASPSLLHEESSARTYIVHVSHALRPNVFLTAEDWYRSTLSSVKGLDVQGFDETQHGPIYRYGNVFHGFAAQLTPAQANVLQKMHGVLSIMEDGLAYLHTTRTPEFLGLNEMRGIWPASNYGEDVIIGVMDSGIWPERESFDDATMGPIPARWKGGCESVPDFSGPLCNKKLIGARSFFKGYEASQGPINETTEFRSVLDSEGHGTHTSSTAAGNFVRNASLFGEAPGTARGMAPRARIAVYKTCWRGGCVNSDILAAFEQAISDGVDIISLSVGGSVLPYFLDPIAIGSFGAMENGILVSASAGNAGPSPQSVGNVAPWLLTVGASTLDRSFPAAVKLANDASYTGASLYNGNELREAELPLIYAGSAGIEGSNGSANLCLPGLLDPSRVKGKIILCDRGVTPRAAKGIVAKEAGAAGMILANGAENGEELVADSYLLPALLVGFSAGNAIRDYIAKSSSPSATLHFMGTISGVKPAPVIAAFSSRGPSSVTPEILKPDVTAPGVNILAAWTSRVGPSEQPGDERVVEFSIMSGTSMSCPHVSGLAALLKAAHPDWSPAAIKSALMTTAFSSDNTGSSMQQGEDSSLASPFDFGSGHVDPNAAMDPGLVYDLRVQDYVDFLCGQQFSAAALTIFTKGNYNCSGNTLNPSSLNYPSLSIVYDQAQSTSFNTTITRTVTNVGDDNSVYTVTVRPPAGVSIEVTPTTLSFSKQLEKKTYTVAFETSGKSFSTGDVSVSFGSLAWSDSRHHVRSPITFIWQA
ncbi:hypothetical protein KP509_05G028800 [Ceratopteris richardii]|uniref:Subtilisin-like protease SBT1.7 n=1 Tax=Ceratopteris richardii TaxID=49495 RepID=A0A8T2UTA2_CERRI|nr:hypothetical protein KP509_05G028800 [Ceratopteris richardii]